MADPRIDPVHLRKMVEHAINEKPLMLQHVPGYHDDEAMVARACKALQEHEKPSWIECEGEGYWGGEFDLREYTWHDETAWLFRHCVHSSLKNDKGFWIRMLQTAKHVKALRIAPTEMRRDLDFMTQAVAVHGYAYRFALPPTRNSEALFLEALVGTRDVPFDRSDELVAPDERLIIVQSAPMAMKTNKALLECVMYSYDIDDAVRKAHKKYVKRMRRWRKVVNTLVFMQRLQKDVEASAKRQREADVATVLRVPGVEGAAAAASAGLLMQAWDAGRAFALGGPRGTKRARNAAGEA